MSSHVLYTLLERVPPELTPCADNNSNCKFSESADEMLTKLFNAERSEEIGVTNELDFLGAEAVHRDGPVLGLCFVCRCPREPYAAFLHLAACALTPVHMTWRF